MNNTPYAMFHMKPFAQIAIKGIYLGIFCQNVYTFIAIKRTFSTVFYAHVHRVIHTFVEKYGYFCEQRLIGHCRIKDFFESSKQGIKYL